MSQPDIDPIAICLEHVDAPTEGMRHLRCVALPGGERGLGLDKNGFVIWETDEHLACRLFAGEGGRLYAERVSRRVQARLERGGRALALERGRPVEILQGDRLKVAGRTNAVHIHAVHAPPAAPSYWSPELSGGPEPPPPETVPPAPIDVIPSPPYYDPEGLENAVFVSGDDEETDD